MLSFSPGALHSIFPFWFIWVPQKREVNKFSVWTVNSAEHQLPFTLFSFPSHRMGHLNIGFYCLYVLEYSMHNQSLRILKPNSRKLTSKVTCSHKLAIDILNIGWPIFKMLVAVSLDFQKEIQQTIEGVYQKNFCSISGASKRMVWLISSSVAPPGGVASNRPDTVTNNPQWETFINRACAV